jgi:hypothetical protein
LDEVVARTKRYETCARSVYWKSRLENIQTPFLLRMMNGMSKTAPEVTVLVDRVYEMYGTNDYDLRLAKVVSVKNF